MGTTAIFFFQVLELKNANEDEAEDEDDKYTKNHYKLMIIGLK